MAKSLLVGFFRMPMRTARAIALCGTVTTAHAIESPPDHRSAMQVSTRDASATQMQRDREQREAEARARELAAPDVRSASSPAISGDPVALPVESPCYVIDRFELSVPDALPMEARRAGASALPQDPFAFAAEWLDGYRGKCIGEQGIQRVVDGLGARILARGYVTTRLRIAQQDLGSHVLRLDLVPGMIHAIRFDGDPARASWRTAFPVRAGDILKLQDVEQALVQLKQVPGQDAYFRIEPASEPGQSDIVVSLTRERPWRLTAIVDNGGTYATGKLQGTAALSVDNPLGLNDRFSAALSHDLMIGQRGKRTNGWNSYYAMPYGFWSGSLTAAGSGYSQRVKGRRLTYVSSGHSTVVEAQLARNLLRTHAATLGLQFRLGKRFGRHWIEDTQTKVQYQNNTYAQWGIAERHYLGRAQLDTLLAYRQGLPWFGAQADLGKEGTTYRYRMGLLDTNLSVPFSVGARGFVYTSAFHGQWTPNRLYTVDQLAIGTRWTVRGFDGENTLSAERGFYWRHDLAMSIAGTRSAFYIGADYGQVFGPGAASLVGTRLAGAAIGVRGVVGRRATESRAAIAAAPEMTAGMSAGSNAAVDTTATGARTDEDRAAGLPAAGMSPSASASAVAPSTRQAASAAWALAHAHPLAQVPGVLSYDVYAGTPLWKPHGFPTAQITVGFQLAYQY